MAQTNTESIRLWSCRSQWPYSQSTVSKVRQSMPDYCSPMFFRPIGEDWISILSGTLDDPEVAPPGGHYGIESRISWLHIVDDLKQLSTEKDVSPQEQKTTD